MKLNINSEEYFLDDSYKDSPLLWVLRDALGMKGTKYGCGIGACGSCTVLVDNNAVPSCLISTQSAENKNITTIEGLSGDNNHPLQIAWNKFQVPQCGYCQSGQIMTALSLLNNNPSPKDDDIKRTMSGVLCRCGTYPRIVEAIKAAAKDIVK